jgi:Sec-independent protein translocase protein TatA
MQDGGAFVNGFAFQIPNWIVLIILAAVLLGAWKLGKLIWSALSH